MDVRGQLPEAAVGQPARAVEDVALEQRADLRPHRRQRALPVGAEEVGERRELPRRVPTSGSSTAGSSRPSYARRSSRRTCSAGVTSIASSSSSRSPSGLCGGGLTKSGV